MFDVSTRGVAGVPLLTGFTQPNAARWQTLVMSNDAGAHLIAVNGSDAAILFQQSGVHRIVAGDGTAANTWAGLDPIKAIQLTSHQGRLWAVEKDTTKGWYLPVGAITGTLVSFDFGPQFKRGGYLRFLSTWTIDDGNGAEDHLVAVSSNGEAVVYSGTDPNDDTKWTQVGVYFVGAPLSYRSYAKVGADLMILSQRGVVSMASLLSSTKINQSEEAVATSDIQWLVAALTTQYTYEYGWQLIYYPPINQLLFNLPNPTTQGNRQLVSNQVTTTQPWATFTGLNAVCWGQYGLAPMFGDKDGKVLEFWYGNADGVLLDDTGGANISATVQQAYSFFGAPALQKQIGMYRPNLITSEPIAINTSILYDFSRTVNGVPNAVPQADLPAGKWDVTTWNNCLWGAGGGSGPGGPGTPLTGASQRDWYQANGIGVAAALTMTISSRADVLWISTDYSYKVGTIL